MSETNSGNFEHYETNPIFCDVAKKNNIEEWQIAAIQPLFCIKHNNDKLFHILNGYCCTRYNSVKKVMNELNVELNIPLFEIPNEWVLGKVYTEGSQRPKFQIQLGLFDEKAWTNHPFEPYKATWNDDDSFHVFS